MTTSRPIGACLLTLSFVLLLLPPPAAGAWDEPAPIPTSGSCVPHDLTVAFQPNGNGMAAWLQCTDTADAGVWAARYLVGTGWGDPVVVADAVNAGASVPRLAMDAYGDAIMVWEFGGSNWRQLWFNRFTPTTGWGQAARIETTADFANAASVACDAAGNAVLVFLGSSTTTKLNATLWALHYTPATGWGQDVGLYSGYAYEPHVSVDARGNAVAGWRGAFVMNERLRMNTVLYTVGEGWGTSEIISVDPEHHVYENGVWAYGDGGALAVWRQGGGSTFNVMGSRHVPGLGWTSPVSIDAAEASNLAAPTAAVSEDGRAVVGWIQWAESTGTVSFADYEPGVGWSAPARLGPLDPWVSAPAVGMDARGRGMVFWLQGAFHLHFLHAARWEDGGWNTTTVGANASDAVKPLLAVAAGGDALAVWTQSDPSSNLLWSARFVAPEAAPPYLRVRAPANGSTAYGPTIPVTGVTEPGVRVTVAGVEAAVDAEGAFAAHTAVVPGLMAVEVVATDSDLERSVVAVSIHGVDGRQAVRDALAAARLELDLANASIEGLAAAVQALQGAPAAEWSEALEAVNASAEGASTHLAAARQSLDEAERILGSPGVGLPEEDEHATAARAALASEVARLAELSRAAEDARMAGPSPSEGQGLGSEGTWVLLTAGVGVVVAGVGLAYHASRGRRGTGPHSAGPSGSPFPPAAPPAPAYRPAPGLHYARWAGEPPAHPPPYAPFSAASNAAPRLNPRPAPRPSLAPDGQSAPCPRCERPVALRALACPSCGMELAWE